MGDSGGFICIVSNAMLIVAGIQKAMSIVAKTMFMVIFRAKGNSWNYRNCNSLGKFYKKKFEVIELKNLGLTSPFFLEPPRNGVHDEEK